MTLQKFLIDQNVPSSNITTAINQLQQYATDFAQSLASNVVYIVLAVSDALVNILLVVVLSFYLTLDGKRVHDSIFSIAPSRSMPYLLVFEDALNRVVGNYIRGQLTLALLIGIFAGVGCAFLGLRDYALIIGVLAFLFETIPMVGPALASIPAILLSLLLPDPFPRSFWLAGYFVIVQVPREQYPGAAHRWSRCGPPSRRLDYCLNYWCTIVWSLWRVVSNTHCCGWMGCCRQLLPYIAR